MVDMVANRSDTYMEVIRRACAVLKLEEKGKIQCLFKLNGSLIPQTEEWSLDYYLQKATLHQIKPNLVLDMSLLR